MKKFKAIEEYYPKYWEGKENIFVRYWVYLNRGLDMITQARYLILGILGLYAVLKFTNPIWMAVMFFISLPILIIIGRWQLYKVSKTQEFITNTKGTVLGYTGYNMQVRTIELLEQISKKLDKVK